MRPHPVDVARHNVVSLLAVNLATGDGDLFVGTDDMGVDELRVFVDEVRRIIATVAPP